MPRRSHRLSLGSLFVTLLLNIFISIQLHAAPGDADANGNGLIDIDSLEKLNAIRYQLDGSGLKLTEDGELDSSGCPTVDVDGTPTVKCHGYEIIQDLDFDTNGNGQIDEGDTYWNEGQGWQPIAHNYFDYFTATFNGNGHVIKNLYLNRSYKIGLFSKMKQAVIENLVIAGNTRIISNSSYVGAIVGHADENSVIRQVSIVAYIKARDSSVGGLVGRLSGGSRIENSMVSGSVETGESPGGIVGYIEYFGDTDYVAIRNSFSTATVRSLRNKGGLVYYTTNNKIKVVNSYWAVDLSQENYSTRSSEEDSYVGLNSSVFKCAIAANTNSSSGCVSADGSAEGLDAEVTVFKDWDSAIWDFGNASELPALKFNGVAYRNNDNDIALDTDDEWPENNAAWKDSDQDTYPDSWNIYCDADCRESSGLELDQFPNHNAVWFDGDFDGFPDAAENCVSNCEVDDLLWDSSLNDFDNDGILNDIDTDQNNDDVDDIDKDHDGLVEIYNLDQLNAIRYQPDGRGLRLSENGELNTEGCPFIILDGVYQQACSGYELMQDLDFDTNADGQIDEGDQYYNKRQTGTGWIPIVRFSGILEGNGFAIKNLYIDIPNANYIGLFGSIDFGTVRNLALIGPLSSVKGGRGAGMLAGGTHSALIDNVFVVANVKSGSGYVGGVVGWIYGETKLSNAYVGGKVVGEESVGGITGCVCGKGSLIINSLSTVDTVNFKYPSHRNTILGGINYRPFASNSHWMHSDETPAADYGNIENISYMIGLSAEILKCATGANTGPSSGCVSSDGSGEGLNNPLTYYVGWDENIWEFGTDQQFPGLKMFGRLYQDSDGDTIIDDDDAWDLNAAAAKDDDQDGYPDSWAPYCDDECVTNSGLQLDKFPSHAVAWQDDDNDGRPDSLNPSCTVNCELTGLVIDDDASVADSDGDGINNLLDDDDNDDGQVDVDADSDGLIDIDSLAKLNAIRYQLDGFGLKLTEDSEVDTSGCPYAIVNNVYQQRCLGYELTQDLDFDSNANGIIDSSDEYSNENNSGDIQGWQPIGDLSSPFTGIFNGNDYHIKNLFIYRPTVAELGLFSQLQSASILNLNLTGALGRIEGKERIGSLAGIASNESKITKVHANIVVTGRDSNIGGVVGMLTSNSELSYCSNAGSISNEDGFPGGYDSAVGGIVGRTYGFVKISKSYNTGSIHGNHTVGGIVGNVFQAELSTLFNTGSISGESDIGGVIGHSGRYSTISSVINTGRVTGDESVGGVFGSIFNSDEVRSAVNTGLVTGDSDTGGLIGRGNMNSYNIIKNSYWATDSSGQATSFRTEESRSHVGVTIEALQCALTANTTSDNSDCVSVDGALEGLAGPVVLFKEWDLETYIDADNTEQPLWNFGTSNQLPGLMIGDGLFRDADNDEVFDHLDDAPNISTGGLLDTDKDGKPDECDGCEVQGLTQDTDDDNDGILDTEDGYSKIAMIGVDTDKDGIPNLCGKNCLAAGMVADDDDDGDEVLDINDAYPFIFVAVSNDLDRDGRPNECDQTCVNLGMSADTDVDGDGVLNDEDDFEFNPAASVDADNDGFPDAWNDGCEEQCQNDSELAFDTHLNDTDNDGIVNGVDGFENISIGDLADHDKDGRPDECDQACLDLGMTADPDNDNDGILNGDDAFEFNRAASVDADNDGFPDAWNDGCEEQCQNDSELVFDTRPNDTDNDGSQNGVDAFELIAAVSVDADNDGLPDAWNSECNEQCRIDSGLTLDTHLNDTDNDGVINGVDGFETISIGDLADYDNDGRPDECDQVCLDLGMTADPDNDNDGILNGDDAFEFNRAASVDTDNDGYPDTWTQGCNSQCQLDSGLAYDDYPNDTDNDGVTNDIDQDFNTDNGKPTLLTAAPTMYTPVNTLDDAHFDATQAEVDQMFAALTGEDAVDTPQELTFKAYQNGVELVRNSQGGVTLDSGIQVINWVAVDTAGNESEPLEQKIYVYPKIRFKSAASITGEASDAKIIVELTAEAPIYPITVELEVNANDSSADQDDINPSFDITKRHAVVIEEGGDVDSLNTEAVLTVPVLEDQVSENDEILQLSIVNFFFDGNKKGYYAIDAEKSIHDLTLTHQNLAPTVQILLEQNGVEVGNIKQDGGDVAITVLIDDPNGADTHAIVWDLNSLNLNAPLGNKVQFSPESLPVGDYQISVEVTDSGLNPVEVTANADIKVIAAKPVDNGNGSSGDNSGGSDGSSGGNTGEGSSGGSSGGGDISWWFLVFMLILISQPYLRKAVRY